MSTFNEIAMRRALLIAGQALESGDVPVGAVVMDTMGEIFGEGRNQREEESDPSAHAEIVALRKAAKAKGNWRLDGMTLVVTLEPCAMCAGAIAQSRIKTLVFGAWDKKAGAVGSVWDVLRDPRAPHQVEVVSGVLEEECAEILKKFFEKLRKLLNNDFV
jgi:tRNA(adenine34) deaminase